MVDRLSRVAGWASVAVVAIATWTGLVKRFLTPEGAPYFLLTQALREHPVLALLLLPLTLGAYVVGFRRLCRGLDRWRDATGTDRPATSTWGARAERVTTYAFSRWWRISLVLAIAWLPFYLTSFPGQPSPDPSNMMSEFLQSRSDFAGTPGLPGSLTAPYQDYPTALSLLPDGDSLWSDHHPFFLMLAYGAVASASVHVFGSLLPALMLISAVSAAITLVAFGRALAILGRFVPGWRRRAAGLGVVALTPLIAVWSLSQHKNQLFCAAFVWWLALIVEQLRTPGRLRRGWYGETVGVSLLMAVSVQFGWILLAAQALAMLLVRGRRWTPVIVMGGPALLVHGSILLAVAHGSVIPSDPIETKGVQLFTLALELREHPDALSEEERAELEPVLDLDAFVAAFDPDSVDDLKSTGPLDEKTDAYRWRTVQEEDWAPFDGVVAAVASRHPGTALDAVVLKSYRYLDPIDEGTTWYPPWSGDYERTVDGYRAAPVGFNAAPRKVARGAAYGCYVALPCRPLVSPTTKTVVVVLLLAAAIALRRRGAWVLALPFALQLAIAGASPLSAGGRYVLGFVYGLGVVLLWLAIDDREPDPLAS